MAIDLLQVYRMLRPGTAWTQSAGQIYQADDGTPRVPVPTQDEVNTAIAQYTPPLSPLDRIAQLEAQVAQLSAATGIAVPLSATIAKPQ